MHIRSAQLFVLARSSVGAFKTGQKGLPHCDMTSMKFCHHKENGLVNSRIPAARTCWQGS